MKRSQLAEYIKEEIINVLSEASPEEVAAQKELNKELEKTVKLEKELSEDIDDEDEADKAASKAAGRRDSITKISSELQRIKKQMQTHLAMYKDAEGERAKQAALNMLKKLTAEKKALEKQLDA